jgi:uncharacterized membrane protein YfcA
MTLSLLVLYCLSGGLAGLFAGMFGVGGGSVIVPVLIFGFTVNGLPEALLVHTAVGTSLAAIMVGLVSSAYSHWRRDALSWFWFVRLAPGMFVGVLLGGTMAGQVSGSALRMAVVLLLFLLGLKMLFNWQPNVRRQRHKTGTVLATGGIIGGICAFTGIGGGGLSVPFMNSCGVHMRQAIATSAACGVVVSMMGALSYIFLGWAQDVDVGVWGLGYVDLMAVLCIGLLSIVIAPIGVGIAHRLDERKLRIAFAWLLLTASALTAVKWH